MIDQYFMGRMTVKGEEYHRDLKVIDGRVVPDWWREEGHRVEIRDIEDILSGNPDVLVIGKGYAGNMKVSDPLRKRLTEGNIKLIAEPTSRAVEIFNELYSREEDVAGAFHLTC